MSYLIYDIVILVVLILFALWGRHRGLILSVFSLLALLVAIIGGLIVSNLLTPTISGWIQPTVENAVSSVVQSALPEAAADAISNYSPEPGESPDGFSLDALQDYLAESDLELPEQVQTFLDQMAEVEFSVPAESTLIDEIVTSAAETVTESIVRIVLFLLAFILLLILWHILARALNLVSRLPGLNSMNKLGGFLFGALRGALFLFVCAWLLQKAQTFGTSLIPSEAIEHSYLLNFFFRVKPLEFMALL